MQTNACHPPLAPLDEPLINALGTALVHMQPPATKGMLFTDASKLYAQLDQQLDAAQTDKKRWGVDWLPAGEATEKQKNYTAAQAKLDQTAAALRLANMKVPPAQESLHESQHLPKDALNRDTKIQKMQQKLNAAVDKQKQAQSAYDAAAAALAALPAPNFPDEIALDNVPLSLSPAPVPLASAQIPASHHASNAADHAPDAPTNAPADTAADSVTRYAVAFAIAPDVLLTAASPVEDATDIQITTIDGKNFKAKVLRDHHADGIALLRVKGAKFSPLRIAPIPAPAAATGSMTCLSFPAVDFFNPIPKSLTASGPAQTDGWTIRVDTPPRLPGGPLLKAGQVVGVELGDRDSDLSAIPAATLKQIQSLVAQSAQADSPAADPAQAIVQVTAEH